MLRRNNLPADFKQDSRYRQSLKTFSCGQCNCATIAQR